MVIKNQNFDSINWMVNFKKVTTLFLVGIQWTYFMNLTTIISRNL